MCKLLVILAILFVCTCCENTNSNNVEINLGLNWFPESEHGGFYAALVHGYYEEEGLKVNILPGGPGNTSLQDVARKNINFAVTNADRLIMIRAQGAKLRAIMAPIQKSPRCIMVHQESSIYSLEDLHDITFIVSPAASFFAYLQKKIPLTNVKFIPYKGSLAPFLLNKNSVQQAYVFSEPFLAENQGTKVRNLMVADILGFNPYTSVLVTHEESINNNKQLVTKMVRAVKKGWIKYIEDPQKTNEYINSINPQMDMDVLTYGAKSIKPLVLQDLKGKNNVGQMVLQRWETLIKQMIEVDVIKIEQIKTEEVFHNEFLNGF